MPLEQAPWGDSFGMLRERWHRLDGEHRRIVTPRRGFPVLASTR
ncbi:MAG: hypothetical protein ACQERF_12790 [Actinomycetota bacterium]